MNRIAIVGFGRFGHAFAALLADAKFDVRAYDSTVPIPAEFRVSSLEQTIRHANIVVLAVPVHAMSDILSGVRPFLRSDQVVCDVGSVKVKPVQTMAMELGASIPWVGTHPLFGPVSLARAERPLRVVICPNALHPTAVDAVSNLYQTLGCDIVYQTAEEHDQVMAQTHVLAFFIAKGLLDMGAGEPVPFAPPSFQAIARTLDAVRSDAGHLFRAIQNENPFAKDARKKLIHALFHIDEVLESKPSATTSSSQTGQSASEDMVDETRIPELHVRLPELHEAREQIDQLDRELIELLARRAELAQRAARAKATLGHPITDPQREQQLFESRKQWAREASLPEDAVDDIFRAIVRFSRQIQKS